jgi:hypothetical protein
VCEHVTEAGPRGEPFREVALEEARVGAEMHGEVHRGLGCHVERPEHHVLRIPDRVQLLACDPVAIALQIRRGSR